MSPKYELMFGADLIIRDRVDLATFVVFFDKTFLPYTNHESSQAFDCFRWIPDRAGSARDQRKLWEKVFSGEHNIDISDGERTDVVRWEAAHQMLFAEGILERLSRPVADTSTFDFQFECELMGIELQSRRDAWHKIVEIEAGKLKGYKSYIKTDVLYHLRRNDVYIPQVFTFSHVKRARGPVVAAMAKSTFRYFLPRLRSLRPEDLMNLRLKTRDTREGFLMHLQKLSKGLDELAKGEASFSEVCGFAQNIVETDLIPDYREFKRQLGAMRVGRWGRVLDAGGHIAEIDAAPWTPKFWAQLLKAFGMTAIASSANSTDVYSNRYQAFQLMSTIEDNLAS